MTVYHFLRLLPLMAFGAYFFAYTVKHDVDYRAFWAILGAVALFLAGMFAGVCAANSPSVEEPDHGGRGPRNETD